MRLKSYYKRSFAVLLMFVFLCSIFTACSRTKKNEVEEVSAVTNQSETEDETKDESKAEIKDETKAEKKDGICIKYVGNSCFYITFLDGTKIVTDPYGTKYGSTFGKFPELEADALTISHTHDDHTSGISEIGGDPKILKLDAAKEGVMVGDVKITAYASKHVANMGDNTIFVFEENGYKIVHMGETDNIDSEEAKEALKDADVLFTYAGEYGEIENKDSFKTLENLNIKVFIPQHYSNLDGHDFYGQPTLEEILEELPDGMKVTEANVLYVTKDLEKQFLTMQEMGEE